LFELQLSAGYLYGSDHLAKGDNKKKSDGGVIMAKGMKSSSKGAGFQFRIRGPRDFYGGLALIALAIFAILAASNLPGQQGFVFGPGTAPRMFAMLLAVVGALVALTGLLVEGPKIDAFAIRGPAYVLTAILVFAGMIRGVDLHFIGIPFTVPPLGLVLSAFCAFMISIMASREMRWLESLLAASAMTLFCVLLFVYLLQLPFQLWPWV
jgi:putative tricarboxylic transport membrane protein